MPMHPLCIDILSVAKRHNTLRVIILGIMLKALPGLHGGGTTFPCTTYGAIAPYVVREVVVPGLWAGTLPNLIFYDYSFLYIINVYIFLCLQTKLLYKSRTVFDRNSI